MNANELADELNRIQKIYPLTIPFILNDSATMLRQQQADITLLIKNYDSACFEINKQQAEIESLKDEVAMWQMSYENCHRMCSGYGMN